MKSSLGKRDAGKRWLLAEARAWREVARRIGERGCVGVGLCREITELDRDGTVVSDQVLGSMRDRVSDHLEAMHGSRGGCLVLFIDVIESGAPSSDRTHFAPRVLAALFLALECEDEATTPSPLPPSEGRGGL